MLNTGGAFTADELENSFPMDVGRRFRDPANNPLLNSIISGMREQENRSRRRGAAAEKRWRASIEALLANLVAAHLNVIDPTRYVAVSFNRNQYYETELTLDALKDCRDYLRERDLVDVAPGFQRWDADGVGQFGRRTRIRATDKLQRMIDHCELRDRSLTRAPQQLIQMKAARSGLSPAPASVERSRSLLAAINARLATTQISLPKAWQPVLDARRIEDEGEEADAAYRKRSYAGDLTAVSLYRVFKYNWRSGGRIYGGWWMSLPSSIRPYLRINGSPVVELDYKSLHPVLLYQRANTVMPDEPYLVEPWRSREMRDLGKRTFNRLLNRHEPNPAKRTTIKAATGDTKLLKNVRFKEYLAKFTQHLSGIEGWFGLGMGLRLQYEDSVLALDVLRKMEAHGIPVLPIHDSFIVAEENGECLYRAMVDAFHRYEIEPKIERKGPRTIG